MTIYKCARCKYETVQKSNFKKHLNCKEDCKVSCSGIDIDKKDIVYILENNLSFEEQCILKNENEKLKNENEKLKKELDKYKEIVNSSNQLLVKINDSDNVNITANITDNRVTNFIINNYDNPNTSHIDHKFCDNLLKNNDFVNTFIKMVEKIWFDMDHPENHSLIKTTTTSRDNEIKYLHNGVIKLGDIEDIEIPLSEIVIDVFGRREKECEKYYELCNILDNLSSNISDEEKKIKEEFYKKLNKKLQRILYNYKNMVKKSMNEKNLCV